MFWQGEPGYLWENSNTASKKLYPFMDQDLKILSMRDLAAWI